MMTTILGVSALINVLGVVSIFFIWGAPPVSNNGSLSGQANQVPGAEGVRTAYVVSNHRRLDMTPWRSPL